VCCSVLQCVAVCSADCMGQSYIWCIETADAREKNVARATPNTLQHTATHCNTIQLTATRCTFENSVRQKRSSEGTSKGTAKHCSALQHTATYGTSQHKRTKDKTTLQHTATHCNTLQHTATHCNTLQHTATHCNILQHTATKDKTTHNTGNTMHHMATFATHCITLNLQKPAS